MQTLLLVLGTRPEAIKMAPVYRALTQRGRFRTLVCLSGQHRDLVGPVLEHFGLPVDYDLALGEAPDLIAGVLTALPKVLEACRADLVLVHGDTTTAYAAALCCFHRGIPVGHVEAGLRTYDLSAPCPEEFNRRSIALMAAWHFAPTAAARDNLLGEAVAADRIFVTGNTGLDALAQTLRPDFTHPHLTWAQGHRLILLTAHRRESWGTPLGDAFRGIRRAVEDCPEVKVLFPVHPNPVVQALAQRELAGHPRIRLTQSLEPGVFHNLLARSDLVVTDSGGIQEEAAALGLPLLVLRSTTERVEAVAAGAALLTTLEEEAVYGHLLRALSGPWKPPRGDFYGDGQAARRIAAILEERL